MKKTVVFLTLLMITSLQLLPQAAVHLLHDNWKAKRASDVLIDGCELTSNKFMSEGWIEAVVPGTVLTTLLHNRLVPDPFYGMNNNLIPDIYDTGRDEYTYWFYNEFGIPALKEDQQVWLSFRGINYFADIFLNGHRVNASTHRGMFLREKYLITQYINSDRPNRLAVRVAPPDPPGNAAAGQGGDGTIGRNVTMQFTAGWDWTCPVPDRNTGIWDQAAIEITGAADIRNPYVETRVPGIRNPGEKQAPAFVRTSVEIKNPTSRIINGTLRLEFDKYKVSINAILEPYEEKVFSFPEIKAEDPRLWWPNGIGDQPLYNMKIDYSDRNGSKIDSETLTFGIRETSNYFDSVITSQVFTVNGQKIFIKGGNWIASDALLRLSKERYDAEIRLHADMNMNMIRVWGGGLTERPEFYEACDKYGILVWQDIWITGDCNGEWDDPLKKESQARRKAYPDDHDLFLESLTDQIKMLRNHPSLYLWCGGNETYPPADILLACEKDIFPRYDPARFFLDMSTSPKLMTNVIGGVGDGPYGIREPEKIFTERSFPFNPETGSIGIPNYDGLIKFIPEDELKPPQSPRASGSWAYHKYLPLMDFPDRYGRVKDVRDFCMKAQLVSYEQYRALQEAFNHKMWDWYTGMLVWKNQNPWTSLRGFFYDYYLDYTGAYFGYKHAAAPLHIQLNLNDSVVCVLNQTSRDLNNVTASVALYDLHGKSISEYSKAVSLKANNLILLNKVVLPETLTEELYFLKLILRDKENIIDENLYWLSNKPKSYAKLNELTEVTLKTDVAKSADNKFIINVSNPSDETAFFIRLKVNDQDHQLVLPVFLSENYFTLLPGESRTVELDIPAAFLKKNSGELSLFTEGWNIKAQEKKF